MTASADKVQFLLQSLLEQTLPLVKKGIFSQEELRLIMLERQKHQNKLYSTTFKLSHFLKAIEFQYDLERQRLYKIKNSEGQHVNPLFRKQAKTDFAIIKRVLKLWDRTMHKFRYRTYLWKQYLAFCIQINSKKHFYKALTNALRFLPFELQLWKIGVRYEVQIGKNMWKARRLFHKGLRLVPAGAKNIQLTKQLIKFEMQFVQTLQARQQIIKGRKGSEEGIKFITDNKQLQDQQQQMSQQQSQGQNNARMDQLLKLKEYGQVLFLALSDSVQKNYKSKNYFKVQNPQQRCQQLSDMYLEFLQGLIEQEQDQLRKQILVSAHKKLSQYRQALSGMKLEALEEDNDQMQEEKLENEKQADDNQLQIQQQAIEPNIQVIQLNKEQKYSNQILQLYQKERQINQKKFTKYIKQFCLKPIQLNNFLSHLFEHFLEQCLQILTKNQWLKLPQNSLKYILQQINKNQFKPSPKQINYLQKQIKKINSSSYPQYFDLLKEIINFNKLNRQIQENNKLFRSILVNCKKNIEFIERAKCAFVSQ